ncbi:flagellar hook-associated protein FlgL [Peribacillus frigoritolerans]|uniref:flagellar hook-associated protein FlgL n=1 Tax=Peribacillus frigoritolerans TaxID=450367 RepID=UPI0010597AB5|nr:flagellar hook-associated protein FlgL [Peribacillus frigoritolerans]TDL78932.1 flagellar hook-associated protein FlgL [Peribacillus frigoritolerans]
MRVTQSMLAGNSLRNLSKSYEKMGTYQDQLATGKKINRPSDDPVVAMKGMHYRTNLTEVEQYQRNISEAYQWMENSEAGIEQGTQVLQRVRELMVQASNGTNGPEDLKAIGAEIKQLKEDLVGSANTQVAGNYIFNGTQTKEAPVTLNADGTVTVNIDKSPFEIEVSKGVQLKANINSDNVFSEDLFAVMGSIEKALTLGDASGLDGLLSELDEKMDSMSAERAELGARYNRLELIEDRVGKQEIVSTRILSENEDADLEKVIMNLTAQESIHRAALSVGARIIQPTLMDFLR